MKYITSKTLSSTEPLSPGAASGDAAVKPMVIKEQPQRLFSQCSLDAPGTPLQKVRPTSAPGAANGAANDGDITPPSESPTAQEAADAAVTSDGEGGVADEGVTSAGATGATTAAPAGDAAVVGTMHQLEEQPELEQLEQQQNQHQHFMTYYQQQSKDPSIGFIPEAAEAADDFPDDASIASSCASMMIGPDGLPMKKPRRLRPIKNTKKLMRTLSEGLTNSTEGLLRRTASGARLSFDRSSSGARASMESDVSGVDGSTPSMQRMKSLMGRLSFQGRRGSAEVPGEMR